MEITISKAYITLGQLLKDAGVVESGGAAKCTWLRTAFRSTARKTIAGAAN